MRFLYTLLLALTIPALGLAAEEHAEKDKAPWWDAKWPIRKKITLDTTDKGLAIADPIGTSVILIRLHDGNFNFMGAKEDGSDLRFIAEDGKTDLKYHIEKWDGLLNEAYVWVQLPDVKPKAANVVWMYYGNVTDAQNVINAKATYDADTVGVFHFADAASVSKDVSAGGLALEGTAPPGAGLIAGGERLLGQAAITITDAPSLAWGGGSPLTWSAWVKMTAPQPNAVLFSRREGANSFVIGMNNGIPYVEINKQKSADAAAISPAVWHHLAVTVDGTNTTLYVDGNSYGVVAAGLPAIKGPALIGKDSVAGAVGFVGDIDELQLSKTVRPAGFIKFAAISQGTGNDTGKLLVMGTDENSEHEEEGELMKHITLLADISKDLTPDGWAVIGACTLLAILGGFIALGKVLYLNQTSKATAAFMEQWEKVASDLTVLDDADDDSIKTMGGAAKGKKTQKLMHQSPVYHLYHLGCKEVQQRMQSFQKLSLNPNAPKFQKGLSGRSIQAIKATLHGGLMREVQKLNGKLVFLTIGIAGGPYLGLLGTVIGVMITFAVIAKSGQVEVNSIAPGIAGALLATVAGLAVAIPCLFAYSYIATRIKDTVTDMETFIDEFIAKMAEHYKES